jgi:hypothetical protein
MKIEAHVSFYHPEGNIYGCDVNIDKDYVEDNTASILEYVSNELYEMFGHPFDYDEFEVTNMQELIEELAFDEFERKTQYTNM